METLLSSVAMLLKSGARRILVEKPGAISIQELLAHEKSLAPYMQNVFVAYNRRFYSSVFEAQRLIIDDGGLKSMHFEFTEWAHKVAPLPKPEEVKGNWFFGNSTHVIDLAFFIAGEPLQWSAFSKPGNLPWRAISMFCGAGKTEQGVMFDYCANWDSAGRWRIELMTNKRRIFLKPLEDIQIQEKGSLVITPHTFEKKFDVDFKPGVYRQVQAFLAHDTARLVDLAQHVHACKRIYQPMISS
jgi:predicted dehydrogenase